MARTAAFVGTSLLLLAAQGYTLFLHRFGLAANPPGPTTVKSGEVAGEAVLSQTFVMGAAGFNGLVFHAQPAVGPVAGRLVVDLTDVTAGGEHLRYRATVQAQRVVDASRWQLDVPELADSRGRRYRATFSLPDARPGQGIVLLVNRDDTYNDGRLHVAGKEQWGDLVFETRASRATIWSNVEHTVGASRSWRRPLALSLLVLQAVATIVLWYALVFRGADENP